MADDPASGDPVFQRLRLVTVAAIPTFAVFTQVAHGDAVDLAANVVLTAAALTAAAAAWRRGQDPAVPSRVWRCFAAYCLLWAAGQLTWTITAAVIDDAKRVPSWAEVGFVAAVPFAVAAAVGFTRRAAQRAVILLDGLLLALACFIILWATWLGPLAREYGSDASWRAIVITVADLTMVAAVVTTIVHPAWPLRGPTRYAIAGIAAMTLADGALAYLAITERYSTASLPPVAWLAAFLLLATGAAGPALQPAVGRAPARRTTDDGGVEPVPWPALALPYVALVIAAITCTAFQIRDGRIEPTLVYVGFVGFTTLVVRHVLTLVESERRADALARQAMFDGLTGLWNRDTLRNHIDRLVRQRGTVGVLFVDLDDFKDVNETLGNAAGDALLIEIAGRLARSTRREDRIARLGSDEFGIVVGELVEPSDAVTVAGRILDAMREPLVIGEASRSITVSIGIAITETAVDADVLLRNADFAKDAAKQKGKNRYELYEPDLHADAVQRIELTLQLERALERGEFVVHYQPTYDLRSGAVLGAEALIRWRHPDRGLVRPGEFVAVAEASNHIHAIGRWVLKEACVFAANLRRLGFVSDEFQISVNVSPRQLYDESFLAAIDDALAFSSLPPGSLVLELTESSLIDTSAAIPVLQAARARGVRLAIDDFGTGYSALSYLDRLPLDIVKIDRSFVAEVDGGVEKQAMAKAIVVLATSLHLGTIAEGIERSTQADELRRLGCHQAQGYLYSRPVPEEEFLDRLVTGDARIILQSSGSRT